MAVDDKDAHGKPDVPATLVSVDVDTLGAVGLDADAGVQLRNADDRREDNMLDGQGICILSDTADEAELARLLLVDADVDTLHAVGLDTELGGNQGNTPGREDNAHGETALDKVRVDV
ncbi:3-dehydroshikimate dehydratase [Stemphylium lycopersici]|nr:3-dehydroshikimate dehydratase [Stemphylium lycopersici]